MTNAYASGASSITNWPSTKSTRFHKKPNKDAGIKIIAGANTTAARRRGVRAFSGKTHANTTRANCISSAMMKLDAAHQPAFEGSWWKSQKTRSLVVHRARKAMNAAKVWLARLRGSVTKT